ncbi:MAG: hypothetical protein IH945_14085 [Armatimonadetes bacterium]|nr:hypothetical protein [Armatimonadota bacterium]
MGRAGQESRLNTLLAIKVPVPLMLYAGLGCLDLVFSKIAFSLGVSEANPAMNVALGLGFFEVTKALLTILVVVIGAALWHVAHVRRIMLVTNIGMAALVLFHVYGLSLHI